jgi:hypothetical protein
MRLQLPPVLEYQHKALFGPERYAVVEGTSKAGKTLGALLWLLEEAGRYHKANANFWWVAPTQLQADMVYSRTKTMLLNADPNKTCWDSHDTKHRITINGCGHLWFRTGEETDALYGDDVYAAVFDEFTRQRHEAWIAVRTTLTATKGRCRFIGNVKGRMNWGYQLARKAEAGSPNMTYAKITCEDAITAGIMDREEVEQAERDLPYPVFRELYYAEASDDGSNPFGLEAIKACTCGMHKDCEPVAWGWDYARANDWTVGIALCQHRKVCRLERWNQASIKGTAAEIKAKGPRKPGDSHQQYWKYTIGRCRTLTRDTPALVDSTGPAGPIDQALIAGGSLNFEGYVFTNTSKQLLMEGLALSIQHEQTGFPEGIITAELSLFGFEYTGTAGRVRFVTMEGAHDDSVCALALADKCWQDVKAGRRLRVAFTPDALKDLQHDCREPTCRGDIESLKGWDAAFEKAVRESSTTTAAYQDGAGPWRFWLPMSDEGPAAEHSYVVAAAVGSGLGGSPTVIKIADAETRIVAAECTLEGQTPEQCAKIACLAGLLFEGPNGRARLIWNHHGPGVAFGETVRRLGYGRVYRMRKEGEPTGDPGWRWSKAGIATLQSELRNALKAGRYAERNKETAQDARRWIFSDNGTLTTLEAERDSEAPDTPTGSAYAAMLLAHALAWGGLTKPSGPTPMYGSVAWEENELKKDKARRARGRYTRRTRREKEPQE